MKEKILIIEDDFTIQTQLKTLGEYSTRRAKTERKIKNKKMLMVCPYFVKYMRLRTEILCCFISTWIMYIFFLIIEKD